MLKRPTKTVEIKNEMTWWLTKRRVFVVEGFEISLLAINHDQECVKILIKKTSDGTTQEAEIPVSDLP